MAEIRYQKEKKSAQYLYNNIVSENRIKKLNDFLGLKNEYEEYLNNDKYSKNSYWNTYLIYLIDKQVFDYEFEKIDDLNRFEKPNKCLLNQASKQFKNKEEKTEAAISKLFEINPNLFGDSTNDANETIVFLRLCTINTVYSTNCSTEELIAISERISHCDQNRENPSIDDIVSDLKTKRYSLLSKYYSFKYPDRYPIYDSYVEIMLKWYRDLLKNDDFDFDDCVVELGNSDNQERSYEAYKEVIDSFIRIAFPETKVSYKDIDMFLWLAGKQLFPNYLVKKDT